MSTALHQVLQSFDALPEPEKHQAAVEILRRHVGTPAGDVPPESLIATADELFRNMDADESGDAPR